MPYPLLILASSSPQRRRILESAGIPFQVVPPRAEEPDPGGFHNPAGYVVHTAWLKAHSVASEIDHGTLLAADTVVSLNGKSFSKPADRDDARQMLTLLSGSDHAVLTGLCLWNRPGNYWVGAYEQTTLRMRKWSEQELEQYLDTDRWREKAGAYAIQDPDPHVTILHGSHTNVVGLPIELLKRLLEQFPN